MPNIKSSKKDVISSKVAYEKNKADKSAAQSAYTVAVRSVDKAVGKGLLHKNNAARKKSSMTLKLNKLA